jgi:hypothetical protein
MFCTAKCAVCSEIHTKHTYSMWLQCRIFECETLWYVTLPVGFKSLNHPRYLYLKMLQEHYFISPPSFVTSYRLVKIHPTQRLLYRRVAQRREVTKDIGHIKQGPCIPTSRLNTRVTTHIQYGTAKNYLLSTQVPAMAARNVLGVLISHRWWECEHRETYKHV